MRRNIEDIIEGIVDSIDKTILINKIFDGDWLQTTLYTCDYKWLIVGSVVSDGINTAVVTEIGDEYFVITKDTLFTWTSKVATIVQDMYFMRGTALAVNGEWQKLSKTVKEKTPFVWLVKPTVERTNANGQGLERTADLRLYFLDNTLLKYKEEEVTNNVIKPLWAWVMAFFKAIDSNSDFTKFDNYDTRELSRFGTETPQGFEANIITANLSAIEVKFTLPIRRGAKCLCGKTIETDNLIDLEEGLLISDDNEYINYGN